MLLPIFRSSPARPSASSRPTGARRRKRRRFAPSLAALEARALLSTLVVTNDDDSGKGSLRYELAAAQAGDTITFSPKAYGTITLTSGPLVVDTDVTIKGTGPNKVAVSGDDKSDVFEVQGGVTATISGLTVTDGSYAVPDGFGTGGILNNGTLTLSEDVVTDNSAAAGSYGAGGIANFGTLTIAGSTVSGNTGDFGGGINNDGPLSVTDSTISGNTYTWGGGGILSFANTNLTRCVVSGNAGGGIFIESGYNSLSTLTVTDSRIVNNTNDQDPTGQALGAGISAFESIVTVTGSTIMNNIAENSLALGAGIFMGEEPPLVTSVGTTLTVTDSTFQGNQVIGSGDYGQGYGGAIHVDASGIISVSGSSFLGNTVTATGSATGGALDLGGLVSGSITSSTFADNQAVVVPGGTSPFGGSGVGGAISNTRGFVPGVLTISGSTFTNNLAQGGPNGGYGLGGAILNQGNGVTLDLSSSLFTGNSAVAGAATTSGSGNYGGYATGGGLCNFIGATATVSGSTFIANSVIGGAATGAGNQAGPGFGGAIEDGFAALTVTGSTLVGNRAVGGAASDGATAANGEGGGIHDIDGPLQVSGGTIIGNSALGGSGGGDGEGGGVAISGSGANASLTDVLITLNSALGGAGGGAGYGGGLYIGTGAITTLKNTQVVGNRASTAGNDIYRTYTNG